ncbi:amino acid transporter AVT6E-like [Nymphaea colorata]|nr:amino acid transporter AVT6E-like [Nymphaea colorata]
MYSALPRDVSIELQSPDPSSKDRSVSTWVPDNPRSVDAYKSFKLLEEEDDVGDDDLDVIPLVPSDVVEGSGLPGAVFNLTTTIIGAGIMALPATMRVLGLVLGFMAIILMGILSEISIELLLKFSVIKNVSSYGEIVQVACGYSARVVSEICIIVNNAGVLIVYLIIMGDVLSGSAAHEGIFQQLLNREGWWDDRRLVVVMVLILVLGPLSFLQRIDSLSLTSAASVALAVVFVVVSCIIAFVKLLEGKIEAPRLLPDIGSKMAILDLLVVIPIMTNAYVCHFNVQPIYNELEGRSVGKMNKVGRITTLLCIAVYASTAISGYLLFGEATDSDVLTNFDKDLGIPYSSILNYIIRIGYILHLMLVFPVIHFSLRQTVDALVFKGYAPLVESRKRSMILTSILLALIYLGSTIIPNIWVAFKFTGATTGLSLGFIFPSLIALRLNKQGEMLTSGEKLLSWLMLVLALVGSIIGVVGNVYSIKQQSK